MIVSNIQTIDIDSAIAECNLHNAELYIGVHGRVFARKDYCHLCLGLINW